MKYFTIRELCRSAAADKAGIDNTPPSEVTANLTALVDNLLDPLREAWGRPITVNSGYRCPQLNRIVGGVATSHHLRGMAADITTGNYVDNARLMQLVMDLNLPFTQMIFEKGNPKIGPAWVHISYEEDNLKRQVLRL